MYTLFIDTHYKDVVICLFKDNNLLSKEVELGVRNTSVVTMPLVDKILKDNNILPKNLNKIAVCVGPGSFTGTRIGVTIAKALAYTLNIDIVKLTSLDLIAINTKDNVYVASEENNGFFIGKKEDNKVIDLSYLKEIDYEEFKNNNEVIDEVEMDYNKLINFINTLESENAFDVNPIYVKSIEALK